MMADVKPDQQTLDQDVIVGGPGQEAPEPTQSEPAQPPRQRVKLAGREFEVDPELAAALEEREREFQRKLSQQGAELGRLRQMVGYATAAAPTAPVSPAPTDDLETLIFVEPKRAIERVKTEIRQELEQLYRQDQFWRDFWHTFDRAHPDLAGERELTTVVLQRHFQELSDLPITQAIEQLGDRVRREIVRLVSKTQAARREPTAGAVVEGGIGPTSRPRPQPEEKGPKTLSELIRERRTKRHQAPA
jgi:hypothetical protein